MVFESRRKIFSFGFMPADDLNSRPLRVDRKEVEIADIEGALLLGERGGDDVTLRGGNIEQGFDPPGRRNRQHVAVRDASSPWMAIRGGQESVSHVSALLAA